MAPAAERALERFRDAMTRARAGAEGKPSPTVLFVINRDARRAANVSVAGPGCFLDECIRAAGGVNAAAGLDAPYPTVRLETIVRLAPEVIIDNLPPEEDHRPAWAQLGELGVPAVRDGRVWAVRDNALLIPGPHLPAAIARLVELVHGT
jgi:ABC-type Fe3+-hydroxamate transport system substrate-binding protein